MWLMLASVIGTAYSFVRADDIVAEAWVLDIGGRPMPETFGPGTVWDLSDAPIERMPAGSPRKYGGKELLAANGLNMHDFEARLQDFATSRFTTPDPRQWDFMGASSYAYCNGDPVNNVDPTGEAWKPIQNEETNAWVGFEWVAPKDSYDSEGNLLPGLYEQAIFFSNQGSVGSYGSDAKNAIGTSTAYVYKEDGEIVTFEASTNPSDAARFATIPEKRYEAKLGMHKRSYAALRLSEIGTKNFNNNYIDLVMPNPSNPNTNFAYGINIHKPGAGNQTGFTSDGRAISQGCLLIDRTKWDDFIKLFQGETFNAIISVIVSRTLVKPVGIDK